MTPFIIFAIVLTVVYVLYYTVIITMDVLIKPSAAKATEEVIEIDSDDEIASVIVSDSSYEANKFDNSPMDSATQKEETQQDKTSHSFEVSAVFNNMSDIELSFSDGLVSEDLKHDRLIAMGVSMGTVIEETNTEEEGNDDESGENDVIEDVNEYSHVSENAEDIL